MEQIFDIPTALAGWFSFWPLTSVAWVILFLALITALFIKRDEMSGRRNIGADRQLDHDAVKEFYNHFYYRDVITRNSPGFHLRRLARRLDPWIGRRALDVACRSEAYIEILQRLCLERRKKIRLRPLNACSAEVATQALIQGLNVSFVTAPGDQQAPLPENVSLTEDVLNDDATLLFYPEAKSLAVCLLDYLDLETGTTVAPRTGYSFRNKPLFVISIPKSGTHLLLELVRAFGYGDGVVCPEEPKPDLWYCLESSNTHTSAHHLFLDIVHRSHFGNRLHPFPKSPVIFIYRNPLDIVVSEANYYHEDGKTAFSGYLNHLCFEERLIRLIDDPWLLGTIMGSGREVRCLAGFPKCCSRIVRGVSGP